MTQQAPTDSRQLEFLQQVQRLFEEGEFVATYKFALLVSLVDLAIERGNDTGSELELEITAIAEKFIEQYWAHSAPYSNPTIGNIASVLVQNHGRQASILSKVAEMRERFATVAQARDDRRWHQFVRQVAHIVEAMPLWKLQTLRRQHVPFLYVRSAIRGRIRLLPGVAFNLRRFGTLIRLLSRNAWIRHIRSNPRNSSFVGRTSDLELFLFGSARASLTAARDVLRDFQENRCFYCESSMRSEPHVDHFIPWSRYSRDMVHNFVLAHSICNQDKGDMLAAPAHLARWVRRNDRLDETLANRLALAGFMNDLPAIIQVARWAYRQAETSSAQLWVGLKYTVSADGSYRTILPNLVSS